MLKPVSVTFFVHALVVTPQMGALGLLSQKKLNVNGIGARGGQPLVHVYVPSTVNEAVGNPEVGATVTAAVSARTTSIERTAARQPITSAGTSRRTTSLPFATRTCL